MIQKLTVIVLFLLLIIQERVCSQGFYDLNQITLIEISFPWSNWDYKLDSLVSSGEERLIGTVSINGMVYDSVGVRYKGNSSYSASQVKNPINIKLDYIHDDQKVDGYGTLKLSNFFKDPSFVREPLSYEIARNYLPASRCNYAKVYINNTYLGLYSSVQDVDSYFMNTHFGFKTGVRMKGEMSQSAGTIPVWGYLGSVASSYATRFVLESDEGWEEFIHLMDVFNNQPTQIESVLNVDRHLWMLAFDILFVNLDAPVNMPQNHYLFEDRAGRFNPVLWDLNENFGVFLNVQGGSNLTITQAQQLTPWFNVSNTNYPIIQKVLNDPLYRKIYIAHMKTLMEEVVQSGWYESRALDLQALISQEVQNDPNKFYSYASFESNLNNSVGGGPPPAGAPVIGITQLMEARASFLSGLAEFTAIAPVLSDGMASNGVANQPVQLTVTCLDATAVKLFYRSIPDVIFNGVLMFDDGLNGDGVAGDGVYGCTVPAGSSDIEYYFFAENTDAATFLPARAAYEFFTLSVTKSVVINEILASNQTIASDQDQQFDDWIELYNNNNETVSLAGWYLSDNLMKPGKWQFPDTTLASGAYLIIWADNDTLQAGLHANFKLTASGESLVLSDPDLNLIDFFDFSQQVTDISFGRLPNGTGPFTSLYPTIGAMNQTNLDSDTPIPGDSNALSIEIWPNPFQTSVEILIRSGDSGQMTVSVYNMTGRKVDELFNGQVTSALTQLSWQGANYPAGIYFCRVTTGKIVKTIRLVLVK
jgi:hypothetical protein